MNWKNEVKNKNKNEQHQNICTYWICKYRPNHHREHFNNKIKWNGLCIFRFNVCDFLLLTGAIAKHLKHTE